MNNIKQSLIPVSLVIPILNEESSLEQMLKAISLQSSLPSEIIFVDAGSTDNSINTLKNKKTINKNVKIRIISKKGAFPGAGRNIGIKSSKNNWIAFLDCGVVPNKFWLEKLYNYVIENNLDGVFGLCYFSAKNSFTKTVCALSYGLNVYKSVLPGSIFNKDVFKNVGLFNSKMRSYEDVLWMNSFTKFYKIKPKCKSAIVYYEDFPKTLNSVIKKWFLYNFTPARKFVNLFYVFSYMFSPILGLVLYYKYQYFSIFLLIIYVFIRSVISPILKSKNIFWWKGSILSFFYSIYLAIVIDIVKVLAFYSGIFYGLLKSSDE